MVFQNFLDCSSSYQLSCKKLSEDIDVCFLVSQNINNFIYFLRFLLGVSHWKKNHADKSTMIWKHFKLFVICRNGKQFSYFQSEVFMICEIFENKLKNSQIFFFQKRKLSEIKYILMRILLLVRRSQFKSGRHLNVLKYVNSYVREDNA